MLRTLSRVLIVGSLAGVSGGVVGCVAAPKAEVRGAAAPQEPVRHTDPTPELVTDNEGSPATAVRAAREYASAPSAHELGVEVLGLNLSAAGYMLDFRYRVSDPEKAAPFLDRRVKPYLIDQASGAKLRVPNPPKVGPLRQHSLKRSAGRTYFALFANPGRFVKAGDKVTLVAGDCRLANLVVK